jgi:hypothetical protein
VTPEVPRLSEAIERAQERLRSIADTPCESPDEQYANFLSSTVFDLAIIPVKQQLADIPDPDDPADVPIAMRRIIIMTALHFNRTVGQVEADLASAIKSFPTADIRESTALQYRGLLH